MASINSTGACGGGAVTYPTTFYDFQINSATNTISAVIVDDNLFKHRAPKPKGIKAVKLTEENIEAVAKRIRSVLKANYDDVSVTVSDDRLSATYDKVFGLSFLVDKWIVEEYNFTRERTEFRYATLDERVKHDLR